MTTEAVATQNDATTQAIETALIGGDLSKLTPAQRLSYYNQFCKSLNLNPLTKPLAYITLNGKLTLYALKDCTDQLRNLRNVSVQIVAREVIDECYVVTARATFPNGRSDEAIGAVALTGLKGEAKANAMMKCESKSKRRVTLSICGLGLMDESEVDVDPTGVAILPVGAESQPDTAARIGVIRKVEGPPMYWVVPTEGAAGPAEYVTQDQSIVVALENIKASGKSVEIAYESVPGKGGHARKKITEVTAV